MIQPKCSECPKRIPPGPASDKAGCQDLFPRMYSKAQKPHPAGERLQVVQEETGAKCLG